MSLGSSACFRVPRSPSESLGSDIQSLSYIFSESSPRSVFYFDFSMVRTRGGSRLRPRVRFSTPEREAPAPVPAPVPSPVLEAVPEEPQGFRRYQTRMGPRAPSPVPQRRVRRARPSKRARTSGPGESSSTRPPAISSYFSCRGDFITSAVACLEDSTAIVRREPHSGECPTPSQTVPSGVVLRRPRTEG